MYYTFKMKKIITYLLVLTSLSASGQIVNKFRDSTWFKAGVRFDSTLVFSKGAGNGKVWTSNANGTGSWQTFTASGVTQSDLDDSITAVRSVRKVDTLFKSADSIIYKINGIRYAIQVDSQATFSLTKNTAGDSIIIHHNGVRYSAKDSIADVSNLATKTNLKDSTSLLRGLIPNVSGYATQTALNDSVTTLRSIRKVDTSYIGLNAGRDSIVFNNVINGSYCRYSVRDSSITPPTFSLAKNTTRDSIVTIFNGTRTAVKDSFNTARKVDTIYRTAGKDSIIFTLNNIRYSFKDSTGGSGWGLTGNAGTSGYPSNFMGTTDNQNVIFKRNNAFICGLYSTGLGVGINTADNKYIEVQGSTTGNQATGCSYIGYGNFYTYSTNNYGFVQFNGGNKQMGIGIGTDGVTRITTGTNAGTSPVIYINDAYGSNGNVGIGGSPVTSAKLAVVSTTSGVSLCPMTSTQRNAISSPMESLIIYNLTDHKYQYWNGSAWIDL